MPNMSALIRFLRGKFRTARNKRRRVTKARRGKTYYSQDGEDIVLHALFFKLNQYQPKKDGFYVDIGAHHPFVFSNTNLLYREGWRGVNIDALPGMKKTFDKYRPRDINIEMGVSAEEGELTYHMFEESAFNTFDPEAVQGLASSGVQVIETRKIATRPLAKILSESLPENQKIDLMSIDAEGFDFDILQSNDWDRFAPSVIMVEQPHTDFETVYQSEIQKYLSGLNYIPHCKTVHNVIYVNRSLL